MPELGFAIFCVIVINGIFSFWQEFKAEKAIEALQKLLPHYSLVLRDGKESQILSSELVYGDIIFLEEGNLIPVDARLIEASELRVDNSTLTGESKPVYKMVEPIEKKTFYVWTDIPNMVFAGTIVSAGTGKAVVIGTAMNTQIGHIAELTQAVQKELSPIQKQIKKTVNTITLISIGLGILFFFMGKFLGGLTFIGAFVFTIGITVANIPEGLLPTISLALAMGVQRMSKRKVLVKELSSVETLGATNVICTDKTGTLTTSQHSVQKIFLNQEIITLSGTSYETVGEFSDKSGKVLSLLEVNNDPAADLLFKVSILCSNAQLSAPVKKKDSWKIIGDPTEGALLVMAAKAGIDLEAMKLKYKRIGHFPFESVRKMMTVVCREENKKTLAFIKGAPFETLEKCGFILVKGEKVELNGPLKAEIRKQNDLFASEGLRVLGFACREIKEEENQEITQGNIENNLTFIGMVGMIDPPRPEVPEAIAKCRTAGIRIIMITGDYSLTAKAIAMKIGMIDDMEKATVITGFELSTIDDVKLRSLLKGNESIIFARINPSQKMRIVSCLKDEGNIVAVTGDGVNDSVALKKAHIGIAMGKNANDVAKEAASMIVLDGNFASIVNAVEEGRAIYSNIKKFVTYIFTSNVPELVPFVLFVLLKIPLPLTVMQILAVDLGTDLVPALALGVEKPEPGIMNQPPRDRKEKLINLKLFMRSYLFLGVIEAALCMCAYYFTYLNHGWEWGMPMASEGPIYVNATTMSLAGIVACQIGNIFCCRTERQSIFKVGFFTNKLLILGILTEIFIILTLIYVPFFQEIFTLKALDLDDWLFLATFPVIILIFEETRKWVSRRFRRGRSI